MKSSNNQISEWFTSPMVFSRPTRVEQYLPTFFQELSREQHSQNIQERLSSDLIDPPQWSLSPWAREMFQGETFNNFNLGSMFSEEKFGGQNYVDKKIDFMQEQECQTPRNQQANLKQEETTAAKLQILKVKEESKQNRSKNKGLRNLSLLAYEIAIQFQPVTYKEVALKLIKKMHLTSSVSNQIDQLEEKDERNIKRRVYDALNVLIALGVLKKKGKKIMAKKKQPRIIKGIELTPQQQHHFLKQSYNSRKARLCAKQEQYKCIQKKYRNIRKVIKRNAKNQTSAEKQLKFPFIGGEFLGEVSQQKLQYPQSKQQLIIESKSKIQIIGDMDSLDLLF